MRMIGYYALHSFKNQLKKIFKTWVLILILICALVGGGIGFAAAKLSDAAEEQAGVDLEDLLPEEDLLSEETSPADGTTGEAADGQTAGDTADGHITTDTAAGNNAEDADNPETEDYLTEEQLAAQEEAERAEAIGVLELVVGGVLLVLFAILALSADKSGGKIFLPADVNLLFPSPLSPQRVLFFRLMMQTGTAIFASIYILFQIPNLCIQLGLSVWSALAIILVWWLTVLTGKFMQVLIYTVTSTNPDLKKYISPVVYGIFGVILIAFFFFWRSSGLDPFAAAKAFFNGKYSRFIPVWGWLKGIAAYSMEKNVVGVLLCLLGSILAIAVLTVIIRHVKADFYEDAMAKSEQTAELMEAVSSGRKIVAVQRDKQPKRDKIRRDGLKYGSGATVFFHKSLYNRFRFAKLGYFTKTAFTYLGVSVLLSFACRMIFETDSVLPVVFVLTGFVFYRSLGNPLEEDAKMDFFRLIPESPESKIFWSLLGGTTNCLLDLLPALAAACILLPANPLKLFVWLPFMVSVDFYATNTSTFINLAVPSSVDKTIKQVFVVLFVYFGLLPDIGIMAVGVVFGHVAIAAVICVCVNATLGLLFLFLASRVIAPKGGYK